MTDKKSRVVLVTGAAGGIGRAITDALIADGHSVAAVDRDAAALGRLKPSDRIHPFLIDLASESACHEAVASAVAYFGRLDAVINNAGIGVSSLRPDAEVNLPSIEELTAEIWDRFFAINVRAPMLIVQAALPHMRKGGFGRIINNTTSFRTMLRVLPYGATKSALESMSAIWAQGTGGRRHHRQRADPGRADRHAVHFRRRRLGPRQDAAARDHGAAGLLADLGRGRELHRQPHHRGQMGRRAAGRAGRRKGRPRHRLAGARAPTRCG